MIKSYSEARRRREQSYPRRADSDSHMIRGLESLLLAGQMFWMSLAIVVTVPSAEHSFWHKRVL